METIINVQYTAILFLAISLCVIKVFDADDLKYSSVAVVVVNLVISAATLIVTTLIRIWG